MKRNTRTAFTLIEILIVVVIMAILAATIIPQFTGSTEDAQVSTTQFNLNTLRAQIELYKAQHNGTPPGVAVDADGVNVISGLLAPPNDHNGNPVNPYLVKMPIQNVHPTNKTYEVVATLDGSGGWYYDPSTGEIRINATGYTKD